MPEAWQTHKIMGRIPRPCKNEADFDYREEGDLDVVKLFETYWKSFFM
jgi:hypothetical protein